jgi:hypothetical protein
MILFKWLLFPTSSCNIDSSDIKSALHPETFCGIDWAKLYSMISNLQFIDGTAGTINNYPKQFMVVLAS